MGRYHHEMAIILFALYLGCKRNRVGIKVIIDLKKHLAFMVAERGSCLNISVVCILFLCFSRIAYDYKVPFCFSHSITILE